MRQNQQERAVRLSSSATIAAAAVVVVCVAWFIASFNSGWVGRCFRSRMSLYAGAVALIGMIGLYILVGVAWRLGRTRRKDRARSSQTGTAAIEFALLFPFALMIVLVMVQSMLLVAGNLAVHHAAYSAARSAVVWIPENLSYDESTNVVGSLESSAKFHRIRLAAVYAVMPVCAGKGGLGSDNPGNAATIEDGLERFWELYGEPAPNWVRTVLAGKYRYAWNFTEVSLTPPDDGDAYGENETISVQVNHMLYLSVPYANMVFSAFSGGGLPGESGHYAAEVNVKCALTNQGAVDEIDVEQFPRYVE